MENFKKKQHYVWKKYLHPWVINKKIWCKRNNEIFNTSLENIVQERYFYFANPLNDCEKRLIKSYIEKSHPTQREVLSSIYDIYIASSEISEAQKNGIENYHNMIENNAIHCLECLYSKNLSVFKDQQTKINFCYYLGQQYTRTKRMIQTALKNLKSDENFNKYEKYYDTEKVLRVLALFIGKSIGSWIFSNAEFYFIETDINDELITCDQPIYNLNEENLEKEMELFYPITPHLAVFISSKGCNRILTSNELFFFNNETIKKSRKIILGLSWEALKRNYET